MGRNTTCCRGPSLGDLVLGPLLPRGPTTPECTCKGPSGDKQGPLVVRNGHGSEGTLRTPHRELTGHKDSLLS